jgi:hypothetical protein
LLVENVLDISISDWKYKSTVRWSTGRGLRGLINEKQHQRTNTFQEPTYAREVDPGATCAKAAICNRPSNSTSTGLLMLTSLHVEPIFNGRLRVPSLSVAYTCMITLLNAAIALWEHTIGLGWWEVDPQGHNLPIWRWDDATFRGLFAMRCKEKGRSWEAKSKQPQI